MGAYLSEPITKKISSDESGTNVAFGASSMQGWRVSQEDAHNCCIDYDKETSLFAVYDGHGGHEVATYCADELPRFIKNTEAYKAGNIREALIDAFLGFDATLTKPNIIAILKEIARSGDSEKKGKITFYNSDDNDGDDDESVSDLRMEAAMPLEQVIARYHRASSDSSVKDKTQVDENNEEESIGSQSCRAGSRTHSTDKSTSSHCTLSDPGCSSSMSSWKSNQRNTSTINKTDKDEALEIGGSSSPPNTTTSNGSTIKQDISTDVKLDPLIDNPQSSKTCNDTVSSSGGCSSTGQVLENGRTTRSDDPNSPARRRVTPTRKGPCSRRKFQSSVQWKSQSAAIYDDDDEDDDDDDEESDETFDALHSSSDDDIQDVEDGNDNCSTTTTTSSDDDNVKKETDDDDEEEEEDDDDDDEDDDDDDGGEFTMNMTEEPGSDSGCTAVVAILHSRDLYVANAGDSRCVLCRDGEALELSLDHKPEDEPEMERIIKAGGKVTGDGRVNGGLNLSRALGDHAYKQNTALPAHQQMISALPDIRHITIEPGRDEFMIIACDGIWNYMSSHEVVAFIRERLANREQSNISSICEALFDHCLAPDTHGDGTGCDNMTAVIVKFNWKDNITPDNSEPRVSIGVSKKRPISPASNTTTSLGDEQLSTSDSIKNEKDSLNENATSNCPDDSANKDSCKRPKTDIA